jgi:hypothetical protein
LAHNISRDIQVQVKRKEKIRNIRPVASNDARKGSSESVFLHGLMQGEWPLFRSEIVGKHQAAL